MTTSGSSASDFARRQLEKYGWQEGDGLGKERHGIREPIKVQKKNNQLGVGFNPHGDFDRGWWTKVYAKALDGVRSNDTEQDAGVRDDSTDPVVNSSFTDKCERNEVDHDSEKRLRKLKRKLEKQKLKNAQLQSETELPIESPPEVVEPTDSADVTEKPAKEKYRFFVKRATLNGTVEEPIAANKSNEQPSTEAASKRSSCDEKDQSSAKQRGKLQKSTDSVAITHISDDVLLKACEYRTAHYGARHGVRASGKLRRLAAQDEDVADILVKISDVRS